MPDDRSRAERAPDAGKLRDAIREEYASVSLDPSRGYHFHIGRPLAQRLGYPPEWLDGLPEVTIESFAGTGNPFALGGIAPGEKVVDVGCGAGLDSLIAARMAGPRGQVVGIDMTPAMLEKARRNAAAMSVANVEFREGLAEAIPVEDSWADVVLSNGVLNLVPDKAAALSEMFRVLRPGGRLQIADVLVEKTVPASAKEKVDLWTG